MQSLYEIGKDFALQYFTANDEVKMSYRSVPDLV